MKPKVIAVVGPTASGKTKLAIELAHKDNGEVISADSRLVYKGFDIASAKPTMEEREGVLHSRFICHAIFVYTNLNSRWIFI